MDDLDELEVEARSIRERLGRDHGRTGRVRQLGDIRDRVRNSVCNAIKRAMSQIRDYDPALAAHLTRPVLNLGHTIGYTPRHDVGWDTGGDPGPKKLRGYTKSSPGYAGRIASVREARPGETSPASRRQAARPPREVPRRADFAG